MIAHISYVIHMVLFYINLIMNFVLVAHILNGQVGQFVLVVILILLYTKTDLVIIINLILIAITHSNLFLVMFLNVLALMVIIVNVFYQNGQVGLNALNLAVLVVDIEIDHIFRKD